MAQPAKSVLWVDDEAELLKRGEESEHPGAQESVADVVRSRTVAFVEEIHSSLDFYTLQARGVGIERVIVTGGGSKLTGLMGLLGEQLPFEVEAGKAFRRVTPPQDLMPDALAAAEPLLAVAVGLAIPGTE